MKQHLLIEVDFDQLMGALRSVVRSEIQNLISGPSQGEREKEQLLTVREAAELLDVCPQTVHEWKRRGLLRFHKLSGRTYLKHSDVMAALQGHQRTAK